MGKSPLVSTLIPVNLLNNLLASCSLINFDILPSHTVNFDKRVILPFLVFTNFLLSVFFYTSDNKITLFLHIV